MSDKLIKHLRNTNRTLDRQSGYVADYAVRLGEEHTAVRHGPDKHVSQSGRLIGKDHNQWSTKMNPKVWTEGQDTGGKDSLFSKMKQSQKEKNTVSAKLQSKGKTTLLTQQTTRKGGKSSGGGGGKFSWIRRAIGKSSSPWSLLVTDKNY